MRKPSNRLLALAALASAFLSIGACGSGKATLGNGSGGVRGSGGAAPAGGGIESSGGTMSSNPGTGVGGSGAGGKASGGNGAAGLGGAGAGGVVGTGGKATGGAGGAGAGGVVGTGGKATGGAGGTGTGGVVGTGGKATGGAGAGGVVGTGGKATGGAGGVSLDAAAGASCGTLTSTDCNLRSDCHAVFGHTTDCPCPEPGCCMRFDHCADGHTVNCTGPALCKSMPPTCEGDNYTVAYKDSCYEGCVLKRDCTMVCPSAPPTDKSTCGPVDYPCIYEDCAGKGRTLATCAGGTWSVQTTACGTVKCEGVGLTPPSITCAPGQVCVRTSTSDVTYDLKVACVDNTCGANPLSIACLAGLSGSCEVQASATGGSIYCVQSASCQGAGGCDSSRK